MASKYKHNITIQLRKSEDIKKADVKCYINKINGNIFYITSSTINKLNNGGRFNCNGRYYDKVLFDTEFDIFIDRQKELLLNTIMPIDLINYDIVATPGFKSTSIDLKTTKEYDFDRTYGYIYE